MVIAKPFAAILLGLLILDSALITPTMEKHATDPDAATEAPDGFGHTLPLPLVAPRILVSKSKRELWLYSNGKIVRTYHVGLGPAPIGTKLEQGDGRTPEGDYYVCSKNPKSQYYLSLGLSYPNKSDADRGLKSGLINKAQYHEIVSAIDSRSRPPWNTRLGGEIFIHGGGSGRDWTIGCIAIDNENMKELFDAIPRGTPVTIVR